MHQIPLGYLILMCALCLFFHIKNVQIDSNPGHTFNKQTLNLNESDVIIPNSWVLAVYLSIYLWAHCDFNLLGIVKCIFKIHSALVSLLKCLSILFNVAWLREKLGGKYIRWFAGWLYLNSDSDSLKHKWI